MCEDRIGEEPDPLTHAAVAGDDEAGAAVALDDERVEVFRLLLCQAAEAELIEDEEVGGQVAAHGVLLLLVGAGEHEARGEFGLVDGHLLTSMFGRHVQLTLLAHEVNSSREGISEGVDRCRPPRSHTPGLEQLDTANQTAGAGRHVPASLDDMRAQHIAIFSLTVSADCPDYESAYNARDIFQQTQQMADVGGFYLANGLYAGGTQPERPDHITTELEFMSFLALKEAYAIEKLGESELALAVEMQSLFLRDHLGCWGARSRRPHPGRAGAASPFYAAAGELLTNWLASECLRLNVAPARIMAEPQIEWPEPDDGEYGLEGASPLIGLDEIGVARNRMR